MMGLLNSWIFIHVFFCLLLRIIGKNVQKPRVLAWFNQQFDIVLSDFNITSLFSLLLFSEVKENIFLQHKRPIFIFFFLSNKLKSLNWTKIKIIQRLYLQLISYPFIWHNITFNLFNFIQGLIYLRTSFLITKKKN